MVLAAFGPCEQDRTPSRLFAEYGGPTANWFAGRFELPVLVWPTRKRGQPMERSVALQAQPSLLPFTEAEVRSIRKRAVRKDWKKGEVVFRKGDACNGMYDIISGTIVTVMESEDGRCRPIATYGRGHVLGIIAVLDGGNRQFTAVAREASSGLLLDCREFKAVIASRPELTLHINRLLCNAVRALYGSIETAVFLDVPARLARLVLYLHERHATVDGELKLPSLGFSQREIAELLGFSREWVGRELVRWRSEGIIELRRSRLAIRDKSALDRIAMISTSSSAAHVSPGAWLLPPASSLPPAAPSLTRPRG